MKVDSAKTGRQGHASVPESLGSRPKKHLVDGKYSIKDLVDLDELHALFQSFTDAMGFTIGFLSAPELEILIATGWRKICTQYHRNCPLAAERCRISNARLVNHLKRPGQIVIEACGNGLVDCATPIIIKGKKIAILATGQVFLKAPNIEHFKKQAKLYGCNEAAYLRALKDVPVISPKKLKQATQFLGQLAHTVIRMGYASLEEKDHGELLALEIHRRKKIEGREREISVRLQAVFDSSFQFMALLKLNGKVLVVNRAALKFGGLTLEDVRDEFFWDCHWWTISKPTQQQVRIAVTRAGKGQFVRYPVEVLGEKGATIKIDFSLKPVKDENGKVIMLIAEGRDITERIQMEEALRKSEAEKKMVLDNVPDLVVYQDKKNKIIWANDSAAKTFGKTSKELEGATCYKIFHNLSRPCPGCPVNKSKKTGRFEQTAMVSPDGRCWTISASPIKDASGAVTGLVEVAVNTTVQKRAEEDLKKALSLERATLESTADGILVVDHIKRKISDFNERFSLLWNIPDKILRDRDDKKLLDYVLPQLKDPQGFLSKVAELYRHPKRDSFDVLEFNDGRVFERSSHPQLLNDKPVGRVWSFRDVTERKKGEENLRVSEEKFRLMFNTSAAGMAMCNMDGTLVEVNQAYLDIIGYTRDEALRLTYWDLTPKEYAKGEARQLRSMAKTGKYGPYTKEYIRKTGERVDVMLTGALVTGADGVKRIWSLVENITERKRAEDSLRDSEFWLRESQRVSSIGTYSLDIASGKWTSTETLDEIFGIGPKYERNMQGLARLLHPDSREEIIRYFKKDAIKERGRFDREFQIVRKNDGKARWVSGLGSLTYDSQERPLEMVGTIRDITERKEASEEVLKTQHQYQQLVENAKDGIFTLDLEGNFLLTNPEFRALLGYNLKEFRTLNIRDTYPEDVRGFGDKRMSLLRHGQTLRFERPMKRKGGTLIFVEAVAWRTSEGLIQAFVRDITARKKAEDALKEQRRQLFQIIDTVPHMIFAKDQNGRFLLANRAVAEAYQKTPQELIGVRRQDVHKDRQELKSFLKGDREVLTTGRPQLVANEPFTDSRGHKHILQTIKIPFRMIGANEICVLGVSVDVTEQKKVEEFRNDIVRTVSHELRTPLSIEKEGISLLMDEMLGPVSGEQKEVLETIMRNIDRLGRMITSLLDISTIETGRVSLVLKITDLRALVQDVRLEYGKRALRKEIDLSVKIPGTKVLVLADPDKVMQVLSNLVDNAIKFTPQGGAVEISMNVLKHAVECEVLDTGIGIAPDNVPKLFEKFQQFARTAGPGEKGFGLGLSIAKGIIDLHGGQIWIKSELGKGVRATFSLPLYQEKEG